MDALIKTQYSIQSKVNTFTFNYRKKTDPTKGYLRSRREQLITYWKQFDGNHTQILCLNDDDEDSKSYFVDDVFSAVDCSVCEL